MQFLTTNTTKDILLISKLLWINANNKRSDDFIQAQRKVQYVISAKRSAALGTIFVNVDLVSATHCH